MMVEEDFPTSFSARLARKDAGLVLDAAEAHDLRMRIAEAVVARFDETIQAGHGEEDMGLSTGLQGQSSADGAWSVGI
jgi:3-hydroxyisobutyrate dehydrogenase